MYLTTENAHKYLGKVLCSSKSKGHYYPIKVGQFLNGDYYYQDCHLAKMPVPKPTDTFNRVHFDTVKEPTAEYWWEE